MSYRALGGNDVDSLSVGFTKVHEDTRRTIYAQVVGSLLIQIFIVNGQSGQDQVLGNDYHYFPEDFIVVGGGGIIARCQVDPEGNRISQLYEQTLDQGSIVRINAWTAHAFRLRPGTELLRVVDRRVDILKESRRIVLIEP
jgi:hypothetical protein